MLKRAAGKGAIALVLLSAALAAQATGGGRAPAAQPADPAVETIERDPLEIRALVEPEAVLREIEPALRAARLANDERRIALLQLARANACRVVADWGCQREAGAAAQEAARAAGEPQLQVRGLINEGRARAAMQDYTRAERLFGEAELVLRDAPQAELLADVYLAYSSMSGVLGKHQLAADYADRGIALLGEDDGLVIHSRLYRNRARAEANLGRLDAAAGSLERAGELAARLRDPKLQAELLLEAARIAHVAGDVQTQRQSGRQVLAMAEQLRNSQLSGLGREVLGLAEQTAGRPAEAEAWLKEAADDFRRLQLASDELRVLRELVGVLLRHDREHPGLPGYFQRILALDAQLEQAERAQAADDFDARLAYAAREAEVERLKIESELAREREQALEQRNRLSQLLLAVGGIALLALAAYYLAQRRSSARLRALMQRLSTSEFQYRTLAENASDMVVRMRPDGMATYVSPAVHELLGYSPESSTGSRWALLHEDDEPRVREVLETLMKEGGPLTVTYRVRHADGHWVWVEARARRVRKEGGEFEIVYSGRDVSARVRAENALAAARSRLQAVSENIPALVAHVDRGGMITFANSAMEAAFGRGAVIGHRLEDICGRARYAEWKPHVEAALDGRESTFEGSSQLPAAGGDHQVSVVPDVDHEGAVHGYYLFLFDITRVKDAERAMRRQAREDALTGLANRAAFDLHLPPALSRASRAGAPVALIYLDLDRFKEINDSLGHAAGDAVLREFSRRLLRCVRQGDLVARLGGDEFAVFIEGVGSEAAAEAIAAKLIAAMAKPIALAGGARPVGTSVGIGYARGAASQESLMAAADQALYAAKSAGRGVWRRIDLP